VKMSRKLYHVGFEKVKKFVFEHKKLLREPLSSIDKLRIASTFGKSYYELAILDFFKHYAIIKEPSYAITTFDHLKSTHFISETLKYSGLYSLLHDSEKESAKAEAYLQEYFYACVFVLCDKVPNENIKHSLFELNFLHYSASINNPSGISLEYEAMVKNLIKPNTPKESFGEIGEGAFFRLILNGKSVVELKGSSIKTMRKKAYKMLFRMILDGNVDI
jgi:hypothetical protein